MKIVDVQFLTPARVRQAASDQEVEYNVDIDVVNRKVYHQGIPNEALSEAVFTYLDEVNTLPEDFFRAPDEIVEQAAKVQEVHEELRRKNVGSSPN